MRGAGGGGSASRGDGHVAGALEEMALDRLALFAIQRELLPTSSVEGNLPLERHRVPISLCLAGAAVVMNILAAILSLMALSVS